MASGDVKVRFEPDSQQGTAVRFEADPVRFEPEEQQQFEPGFIGGLKSGTKQLGEGVLSVGGEILKSAVPDFILEGRAPSKPEDFLPDPLSRLAYRISKTGVEAFQQGYKQGGVTGAAGSVLGVPTEEIRQRAKAGDVGGVLGVSTPILTVAIVGGRLFKRKGEPPVIEPPHKVAALLPEYAESTRIEVPATLPETAIKVTDAEALPSGVFSSEVAPLEKSPAGTILLRPSDALQLRKRLQRLSKRDVPPEMKLQIEQGISKIESQFDPQTLRHYDSLPSKRRISPAEVEAEAIISERSPLAAFPKLQSLVSATDRFVTSGETALRRMGKAGNKLADALLLSRDRGEIRAGSFIDDYRKNTADLSDAEFSNFVETLRGKSQPTNAKVAKAVAGERARLNEVFRLADEFGVEELLPSGERVPIRFREDYFPLSFDETFIQNNTTSLVDRLVRSGVVPNEAAAAEFIERYIKRRAERVVSGNLQRPRLAQALEDFGRKDRSVLEEYYDSAHRKIAEVEVLGGKAGEAPIPIGASQLIEQIRAGGGDATLAQAITDSFLGRDILSAADMNIWRRISSFEAATKLGLAVIPNTTQTVYLMMTAGLRPFAEGLFQVVKDYRGSKSIALRSGVILESVVHEMQRQIGLSDSSIGAEVLRRTGFTAVERMNRVIAAVTGRHFIEHAFAELKANPNSTRIRRAIRNYTGLDPEILLKQPGLTEADFLQAGKRMSDVTQFRSSALELPLEFNRTLTGKILTLYKQFIFNQSRLMKRAILTNPGQVLATIGIAVPLVGEAIQDARSILLNKQRPDSLTDRYLDNISAVGALGLFHSLIESATYGRAAESLAGPVLGDVGEFLEAAFGKKPAEKLGKAIVRRIPVVGRPVEKRVFPPPLRLP